MKITMIGGSGNVASLLVPYLKLQHTLRIFDLKPPADTAIEHHIGSVDDDVALLRAMQGSDALIYMAMGNIQWNTLPGIQSAFDVNAKGLYMALRAAREAGITHAVYTSSMSVYDGDLLTRHFYSEDLPPDGRDLYGLTKYLGELVGRNACVNFGMSVNALRMCYPVADARWLELAAAGQLTLHTAASDLARAFDAALTHRNGYQVYTISGEYAGKIMNMSKARRELGWEPLLRPG